MTCVLKASQRDLVVAVTASRTCLLVSGTTSLESRAPLFPLRLVSGAADGEGVEGLLDGVIVLGRHRSQSGWAAMAGLLLLFRATSSSSSHSPSTS